MIKELSSSFFELKETIKNNVRDIMAGFKMWGKEILNRLSEFVNLKDKLTNSETR